MQTGEAPSKLPPQTSPKPRRNERRRAEPILYRDWTQDLSNNAKILFNVAKVSIIKQIRRRVAQS